ncbi:hypothetical protein JCM14076_27750 [Methylosoma difficile]
MSIKITLVFNCFTVIKHLFRINLILRLPDSIKIRLTNMLNITFISGKHNNCHINHTFKKKTLALA